MEYLAKAIRIASEAHYDDTYNNRPYILHPLAIMFEVEKLGETAMCVAVLHDVREDHYPYWDTIRMEFHPTIVSALEAISREIESYEEYIHRLKVNDIARAVKIADLHYNLAHMWENPDKDNLINRYLNALRILGDYENGNAN